MSRAGLARVWGTLGALLALYATGTWIVLQGGKAFAEIPGLEVKSPVTSAYLAVPIIGTLLGILSAVGLWFMRTTRPEGEGLFPVVAIADVGPHRMTASSMVVYQSFFVLMFLAVPAASLFRLNDVILQRGILWHDDDPALGSVVLKNAFTLTRGTGGVDASEYACASSVTREPGYVWLGNMRCDPVKAARLKPFNKDGHTLGEDAASAAMSCARDLALAQSQVQRCEGARDVSEECETSERNCRGVQWLPVVSPLILLGCTLFGWGMAAWLSIEAAWRKSSAWRSAARGREGPRG